MTGAATSKESSDRVASIDLIRGIVMILMSIDHVRVYSGLPAGGPTAGIFFTRWVTHFCAPAFVFLAGTSAFFYARKHHDLPRFLVTRGMWLVVLELTVLRLAWTFNAEPYFMAGVIWAIGGCMILLAVFVKFLPVAAIGAIGVAILAGHNAADPYLDTLVPQLARGEGSAFWKIVYFGFWGGPISLGVGEASLIVLYAIVPWIGVMSAGYAFGKILAFEPVRRDRWCLALGLGAIVLFGVLRGFNLYGDPRPWDVTAGRMPALLAFLNANKYPASLAFLLMTLGPTIAAIPALERVRSRWTKPVTIFGRVPFFYYVVHIPLIHALAILVSWIRLGHVSPWLFTNHPMGSPDPPPGYVWGLPLLYAVTLVANVILYALCLWFARLKQQRNDVWLRYL